MTRAVACSRFPSTQETFLIIENRRKRGLDSDLPGEGLLIWKVTDGKFELVQADGRDDLGKGTNRGDSGDPFPADLIAGVFRSTQ